MGDGNYNSRAVYNERRRKRRRKIIRKRIFCFLLTVLAIAGVITVGIKVYGNLQSRGNNGRSISDGESDRVVKMLMETQIPDWIDVDLIHKHGTARSGKSLDGVKNIVIHYVGNPGTSAKNNRGYYDKSSTEVSSHFVVGLDGEIIQCVPLWERSSASNWRNNDTVSVEVCHPDETGKFSEETYNSVVKLTAWLCAQTGLTEKDVIRHYDITEKICPKYYVENPDAWDKLKKDVGNGINEFKVQ